MIKRLSTTFILLFLISFPIIAKECDLRKYNLGGNFSLTGHDGKTYELDDFKGKIVMIYFGYTFCPDACPLTFANMNLIYENLGERAKDVQVLFITVDPERDTADLLKNYTSFFNENFLGLTADEDTIREVAGKFGVNFYYEYKERNGAKYKLVSHTDRVFLLDRQGIMRSLGSASESREQLGKEVESLFNECKES